MALLLFGQDEIRRAASLLALASITGEIPEYLIIGSLVRARLCEDLAGMIGQKTFAGRYFLCGLLSNIDALLGRPLPEVLERLPVTEDVKEALVSHTGSMGLALDLATRYERADWETASGQAGELGIDFGALPPRYATAVREAARLVSVAPWDAAGSSGEGRAAAGGA
jgi:EAL and modified HD-GYP domain-containing signal transduction protein